MTTQACLRCGARGEIDPAADAIYRSTVNSAAILLFRAWLCGGCCKAVGEYIGNQPAIEAEAALRAEGRLEPVPKLRHEKKPVPLVRRLEARWSYAIAEALEGAERIANRWAETFSEVSYSRRTLERLEADNDRLELELEEKKEAEACKRCPKLLEELQEARDCITNLSAEADEHTCEPNSLLQRGIADVRAELATAREDNALIAGRVRALTEAAKTAVGAMDAIRITLNDAPAREGVPARRALAEAAHALQTTISNHSMLEAPNVEPRQA